MVSQPVEPGTEWTPEPVPCGFCGKPDQGYAKKDKNGKWKPACWACVKPKHPPPSMQPRVKPVFEALPEEPEEPKVEVKKRKPKKKEKKEKKDEQRKPKNH